MWNLVDDETIKNPRPFWDWLRREAPVYEVPGAAAEDEPGYFLISRYEDVLGAVRNHEAFSSELAAIITRGPDGQPRLAVTDLIGQPQARVLGVADGEMHSIQRRLVGRTFSPSRMALWSDLAGEIAERCLDHVSGAGEIDIVTALALPLPLELVTRLIGLPLEDQPKLQAWTDHALQLPNGMAAPEELEEAWEATNHFHAYLGDRLDEEINSPGKEVIGDLAKAVHAHGRGEEGLERWEAAAVLYHLVVGGVDTTVGRIAAAAFYAAEQPEFWDRMRDDPACIPGFVEEILRLDISSFGSYRRTTRDVEIAGVSLPKGSTVTLLWGSANRDSDKFPDPERIMLDRSNVGEHLSFGNGKHLCLGMSLARMEIRVALQALLNRYERMELVDGPDASRRRFSMTNRRLETVRVKVS